MAKTGHIIEFDGVLCYNEALPFSLTPFPGIVMLTWLISLLPLFVCRILGIPVPYARLFPYGSLDQIKGQTLRGDSTMPATAIKGANQDRNLVRNARLATTTWKTWTLFRVHGQYIRPIRVMYGADQVLLTKLKSFIAVRNGAEDCRFAVIDSQGREVKFDVISYGSREEIAEGLRLWLSSRSYWGGSQKSIFGLITFV